MRRFKQELGKDECEKILAESTSGVLAVIGDGGYPYAVPLSFAYENGKIYFHCAYEGHKLDAIKDCPKVSFCVTAEDNVVPERYTTYYKSVIAFGTAKILDGEEKRDALELLAKKYAPLPEDRRRREIDDNIRRTCMVEINIEHLTGKQAKELVTAQP